MIISNTSTLILLAKVQALSIFLDYINKLMIPKIVYKELVSKDSFENLLIKKEIEKKKIIMLDINKKNYSTALKEFKLDEGEAAAYALFIKTKGKAILTDDKELIKLCKIEGIPFICAMAIIIKLFNKKKLKRNEAFEKLVLLYGYGRYSEDIYNFFKDKVM